LDARGQLDQKLDAVGLYLCLVGGAVAVKLAAFCAFMDHDIALFGVGLGGDGLHKTAALACAVAGVYIEMLRPQTKGAVVSRGVAQGLNLPPAVLADEGIVIFGEKLCFHIQYAFLWIGIWLQILI
jgi:hypothetical protein